MDDPIDLVLDALVVAAAHLDVAAGPPSLSVAYADLRHELERHGVDLAALDIRPLTDADVDVLRAALDAMSEPDGSVALEILAAAREVVGQLGGGPTGADAPLAIDLDRLREALDTAVLAGLNAMAHPTEADIGPTRGLPTGVDPSDPGLGVDSSPLSQPGLLGDDPPTSAAVSDDLPPDVVAADAQESRWLNAEIEDMDPNDVLPVGQDVTLAFDVDTVRRGSAVVASRFGLAFPDGTDEVTLTIQLDSEDFDIAEQSRPLRLPRSGKSRGKARFDITPRREGRCFLTATVHHDGNFVQKVDLALTVGGAEMAATVTAEGRAPAAVAHTRPREVGLVITPGATGGYDCVVTRGGTAGLVHFPHTPAALADAVAVARDALLEVVMSTDDNGTFVFQIGIDIPQKEQATALRTMARAGAQLFRRLFFPPDADLDLRELGKSLRTTLLDATRPLEVQIVTRNFAVPWAILYLGEITPDAELSWDSFLGMRAVIEVLPIHLIGPDPDPVIVSDSPSLAVGTALNTSIDNDMNIDVVARQDTFWTGISTRVRRTRCDTGDDLLAALAGTASMDLLYLYCHATAPSLTAVGGLEAAALGLTDRSVSLATLNDDAPTSRMFAESPLVIINACESADMSPLFYDGFVPYFLAKGARGVIGTECKTPALFAAAWAQRFFERFLAGEELGAVALALNRGFLLDHGNPLGLAYGLHCDAEVNIRPALQTA